MQKQPFRNALILSRPRESTAVLSVPKPKPDLPVPDDPMLDRPRCEIHEPVRPLGSLEQMLWLLDQNHPTHFALTALVGGRVPTTDWRWALDRVQARHPLLAVHVDAAPGREPFFCRVDGRPIPLRILWGNPETLWKQQVAEELATPFDHAEAPLVRAVLIQGLSGVALILVAHHAIADGLALGYLLRDILRTMAGEVLPPLPVPLSQDQIIGLACPEVKPESGSPPRETPRTSGYRRNDGRAPRIEALRLPVDTTARLRTRARLEATTVHGALCAAMVDGGRQISEEWRMSPVRVITPVETRTVFGVESGCGLYVSTVQHRFETIPARFWDLARQAADEVPAGKGIGNIVATLGAVRQAVGGALGVPSAAQFFAEAFASEAVLSNLGVLPVEERYGDLTLESVWGPNVHAGLEGHEVVGAATVGGALCLTHTSYRPLEGLLEAMEISLLRACAV